MSARARWVAVALCLFSATMVWPSTALAEDPLPPAVGVMILEDSLSDPTLIRPHTCRTQRAGLDYVGEGLRLKLTGPCNDGDRVAAIGAFIRGLTVVDGEVSVEAKAVSGIDRLRIGIDARVQPVPQGALSSLTFPAAHAVAIEPGRGVAIGGVPSKPFESFGRKDISDSVQADVWNTVAIRLQGPDVWLLVNGEPILHYADDSVDRGEAFFDVVRLGDGPRPILTSPEDTTEVAVVFRNLRVSALADGDPARAPVYQRP